MAVTRHLSSTWSRLAVRLLPALLAGCLVTSGQGDVMRADIAKLRGRVEAMEKRDKEINEQVTRLRAVLDEATALLGRNSADLGTKVTRAESDIGALTGKVEEARHLADELQKQIAEDRARLAVLEQAQGRLQQDQQKIVERVAPSIPEDKENLWKEAQGRLQSGMRDDARRFLRAFVQRFPDDPRAPQAQLQVGVTFAQELKHANAVGEFTAVMSRFSRSPEVAEAMFQLGVSYVALKYCTDAKAIFLDLSKRYPKSPRAAEAKRRLRDLAKISRDRNLCTS